MQYDDAQYGADPYGYPPARSGRRGMLALGGAVVGVAAFAGVIVFAYSRGQHAAHNGAPPLLEADATPTKTRPQDPGGYEVPHQDKLVYERLNAAASAKPGVERLLPPPEQPLPRPVVSPQVPPLQPAPVVAVADVPVPQPSEPMPSPVAASAPPPVVASAPPASALAPAPPAAGQSSQIAALPTAPAKPKPAAPKPAAAPAAPPSTANPATPVKPGAVTAGNPAHAGRVPAPSAAHAAAPVTAATLPPPSAGKQQAAAAKPVPVALTPPTTTAPAAAPQPATASGTLVPPSARPGGGGRGGWRVQLASVPSEAQAQGEWRRLSSRHADVLGGLGVSFAQATVNGSTYYRVQAGVVDETRARSICASLKAQSVGCILVAP